MGIKKILKMLYEDVVVGNLPEKRKWKHWEELSKEEKDAWESSEDAMRGVNKKTTQFYSVQESITIELKSDGTKKAKVSHYLSYTNPESSMNQFHTSDGDRYYLGGKEVEEKEYNQKIKEIEKDMLNFVNKKPSSFNPKVFGSFFLTLDSKEYNAKNVKENDDGTISFEIDYSNKKKKR